MTNVLGSAPVTRQRADEDDDDDDDDDVDEEEEDDNDGVSPAGRRGASWVCSRRLLGPADP